MIASARNWKCSSYLHWVCRFLILLLLLYVQWKQDWVRGVYCTIHALIKADYFCSVVCHKPSLSVKGNVCIVCLVRAWTSYKHVKGRKIKTNAWLDGNKYNFKKFQSKFKLEKMDLKLTETRMEVKNCQIFP